MILNNKVSQRLEIIGFKGAVKKSTSRIQVLFFKKQAPSYIPIKKSCVKLKIHI